MAKPIATPIAFAPLAPPWSLVSLDANFTAAVNALNDYSTYSNYLSDTSGVANAITVNTPAGTVFAYSAGINVQVKIGVTNTSGTINLNVNSLGNQLIKNPDGSNPSVGQLVGGGIYVFQYDGTNFQIAGAVAGFTGFANPSASVGLAAVNGTATTAMRSDGAPALSQTIAPTWTGNHIFRTSSGAGTEGMQLDNSAGDARFGLYSAGTEYGVLQATTNTLTLSAIGAATTLKFNVNAGTALSIVAAGTVTVNAPSTNRAVTFPTAGYTFGNTTDNPTYTFAGSGATTFGGTISATNFTGFANPTGLTGLTAVNGAATTAMRSDGAPALDQSIVPTWTGAHTYTKSISIASTLGAGTEVFQVKNSNGDTRFGLYSGATEYGLVQANTNIFSLVALGASTTLNLQVNAGIAATIAAAGNVTINSPSSGSALATNSGAAATHSIEVKGAAAASAAAYLKFTAQNGAALGFLGVSGSAQAISTGATTGDMVVRADNGGISLSGNAGGSVGLRITTGNAIQGLGPVAAALVDMTPDKGSFTGTFTGLAAATTATVSWVRVGNLVIMTMPYSGQANLSNSTSFTMTGIPASIQPATAGTIGQLGYCTDNSSVIAPGTSGATFSVSGGTMTFYKGESATGWTAAGAKSIGTNIDSAAQFIFYSLG